MNFFLKNINLLNFKNFSEISIEFSEKINCFTGNNGAGKTNLLDAIYYLSFCKSYISSSDSDNIKHQNEYFSINGTFVKDNSTELIYCSYKQNERKIFKRNKKDYQKLADHIGLFPLVIVSPYDSNLISEGSEERRKFLNGVISQYDKEYLNNLLNYNRIIKQRNTLLKDFNKNKYLDKETLEIYNFKLSELASPIYEKRKDFIDNNASKLSDFYKFISNKSENVDLIYKSQLEESNLDKLLEDSLNKDIAIQHTSCGVHKDDIVFRIDNYPIKSNGSQGQQKSFLLSLKLAQFDFIKTKTNCTPILLLDDIFDKLDEHRISKLLQLISEQHFGQIFITDTDKKRLHKILDPLNSNFNIFTINSGNIE